MALLQDLIQQIDDPALKERILQETNKLLKQKKFGLVFEEHLPECTPLYDVPIRVGSKVALKTGYVSDIYTVMNIDDDEVQCDRRETHEQKTFRLDELVTVAEFGEAIYPTLKPIDTVENAPDSDLWHTLIEADNYHALQLLEYLYAEKVDCIYIDPPYNTGAKDWKYNNDDNRKALVAPTGSGQRPGKFDAPATNNETSADFPVMRCAEVMLMYAEAANELSAIPTQEALDALNAVRINANLMGKTLEELSTKEIFRQAVYKERRLELALECDRWFDIVRTGQMTTVFPGIAAYRQLYPIPQTEIENVSDKGGWQNEGYTVE